MVRTRDLFRPPNLLSLTRVPLALAVWAAPRRRAWVGALLALAGITDVLDGAVARWMRARGRDVGDPRVGEWLDPACDKIFAASTALAICVSRPDDRRAIAWAFSREWLQVGFLAVRLAVPPLRHAL